MKKPTQLTFDGLKAPSPSFGGSLLTSNPKTKRPLSDQHPIHLTLRAKRSGMLLPKYAGKIGKALQAAAKKNGIKIYKWANVGNHLHIVLKIPRRHRWAPFIRGLTGTIAKIMGGDHWKYRPHTRIIGGWKKAFRIALDYIGLNLLEADGAINRREIKTLRDLRTLLST